MTSPAPLTLDVRPLVARGEQPFAAIMGAVDSLKSGQALRLLAPFRPAPLFALMANRGFTAEEITRPDGLWEILFTRVDGLAEAGLSAGSSPNAINWPEPSQFLDLAGQDATQAETRIMASLTAMQAGEVLFAALDAEPVALFAQMAMQGHEWAGNFSADGECYRLMVLRGTV